MEKDNKKLRESLANLFKAHGEMTVNMKNTNQTNKFTNRKHNFHAREEWYGIAEDQIDVIEPEFKRPKLENKVQMEQGKGPLAPSPSPLKKVNGKLNGKTVHHKKHIKKPKLSGSQKSGDDLSNVGDKVKNVVKRKQQPRSEGGENRKTVGDNDKTQDDKLSGTEDLKAHYESEDKSEGGSIKQTKNLKTNKNFKNKVQQQRRQQNTCPQGETQKLNLEETSKPIRKKSKLKNDHASSDWKVLPTKKVLERNSDDSMLESDYDSDLDDTYEFSVSEGSDNEYDYDSDDYYYDDDSSAESEASYCDYEDLDDDFEDGSVSDPDYELPKEEIEDLVVHKGLAVTYELESHHDAEFDEYAEDSHIVELPHQTPINSIKQHEAYNVEQLRTLELNFFQQKSNTNLAKSEDDECPKLVPINEIDEGFKLWTSGVTMDDEMFSDCELVEDSDESSITSFTDLSRKYLHHRLGCCDSSEMDEFEEEQSNEETSMQAFVVEDDKNSADDWKTKDIFSLDIEETESCLAEIINTVPTNESTRSKVQIIRTALTNFGEKHFEFGYKNQSRNCLQNGLVATDNAVADESMKMTETEENLASPIEFDFEDEANKNTLNCLPEIESFEIQSNEASKCKTRKSKLRSIFCNSMDSYYVLVLMKSPFFLYGTVNAKLIAGSTEIYGYKLKTNEMVSIHSPRGCCAIPFKPAQSIPSSKELAREDLENKIFAEIKSLSDLAEFNSREVKEVLLAYDPPNDAILLLTRNETAAKIKHIFQQHINENIFPAHIPQSRPQFSSEIMLDCMLNATHENALEIPSQWFDIHLKENSKLMLVGGKSVGKSTFLRYLLNKHLDEFPRILLIDLDIGQPEMFVPQTVSCALLDKPLLGPGFFFQHEPDKAYAVGHTNLALCAHAYMRAVICLLKFCKTQTAYTKVPWLINTMGYNKGFGGELLSVVCSHLQPTDIIQLQSNKPINNFDMLFEPCVVASLPRNIYNEPEYECSTNYQPNHQLHILPSAVQQQSRYQREWQMSAKDLRYIMQLARLSAVLPDEGEWINRSQTFCHNLEKLKILNLVAPYSSATETLKSLESNLVYLCHIKTASSNTPDNDDGTQNYLPPECLGLGIVRAIDYQAKQVFILPAMPLEKLTYINCLALGEMPLPNSLLTEQNPESKLTVPFVQVMNNEATSRAVKQFFYRT